MIGRIDDCSKWKTENLSSHDAHPDHAVKARLVWSKNVQEEHHAPWQHVLGCMDWMFCCLLNVGLWLEIFHGAVPAARLTRPFVFGFTEEIQDEERAASQVKGQVYRILRPILTHLGVDVQGNLGSHSVRKFVSTYARSQGVSKDDKEHRGRWKQKRISDGYDDVQLDYVDAKVAATLCPAGVCHYVCQDPACTVEWIATQVAPNIAEVFGVQLAVLFGRPLLWLAHSNHADLMPQTMVDSIQQAYSAVSTGQNPSRVDLWR